MEVGKVNLVTGCEVKVNILLEYLVVEYRACFILLSTLNFKMNFILQTFSRIMMFFSCFNEINISKFLYLKIIKFEGHNTIKQKKKKQTKLGKFVKVFRTIIRSVFI